MKIEIFLTIIISVLSNVLQIGPHNFDKIIMENDWVFINFYSPTCSYCKQLSPEFNKLTQKFNGEIKFGKLDLVNFKQYAERFSITTYPTLYLFHKSFFPVLYAGQRKTQQMQKWLKRVINIKITSPQQKDIQPIIYYGPKNQKYQLIRLLALRNQYILFRWVEDNEASYVKLFNQTVTEITQANLQLLIKKSTARIHDFGEYPWVSIYRKKNKGILFINKDHSVELLLHLNKLAKQYYQLIFFQIEPGHSQYEELLNYYSAIDQPSLFAINPMTGGLHVLEPPFGQNEIDKFVSDFLAQKLKQFTKSELSNDPHKLTAKNEHLLNEIKKDIVLFMYEDTDKSTSNLLKLAKHIINKLSQNPNIHVFITNVKKNDLKLEVSYDNLPKVFFFRNKMKDYPIEFESSTISINSVISFIKQNTTFDWVENEEL